MMRDVQKRKLDIEKETNEIKERLNLVMELLQGEQNQSCGWKIKKKVKWPLAWLLLRKLGHIMIALIKEERKKLKAYRGMEKEEGKGSKGHETR
ncbi:hypothetical protein KI387_022627, partial [Taxus chinensis]